MEMEGEGVLLINLAGVSSVNDVSMRTVRLGT